jgi:aspartyl-tRNA(Asn)/glutamyl-tRNA(Gln) amidotransferase subunit A
MTYGYRTQKETKNLEELITFSRTEGFGKEVKRRIMLGTFVLSAGYFDAYYVKAQKVRKIIYDYTMDLFKKVDLILLPTCTGTAFEINAISNDPIALYLSDIFTLHSAIVGIPSISLPIGNHSNGMPFGIQLMAKPFAEVDMLSMSENLLRTYSN